ncbi:MAG: hypothetical protein KJT03_22070, partial [Verrucomicrobiae bacterium]|nr:hypothetical protein [Verrucomicrobiae bacterium]
MFILCVSWVSGIDYRINLHPVTPIQTYALNKLQVALSEAGHTAVSSQSAFEINFELGGDLERDAFAILATPHYLTLKAADGNGLLYGALDIVESIRSGTYLDQFSNKSESPANAFRAIKFNLPWRSYRFGPALSQHMETARDLAFWERFLDMMVENRFNALTLWNLHPFSNMIRARNFPFACDLKNDEELADWQNFYHELFRLAMERGIDTYIVNWNIFVPDGFVEHYGLPRDQNIHKWNGTVSQEMDEIIRRYTRESV